MYNPLSNPDILLGLIWGLVIGGMSVAALVTAGHRAAIRRIETERELLRERAQAARQAAAWRSAGAANDESPHQRSARAELRGGPR